MCDDGIIYIGIEIGTDDGGEIVAVNSDGTENWRQRLSNTRAEPLPVPSRTIAPNKTGSATKVSPVAPDSDIDKGSSHEAQSPPQPDV